MQCGRGAWLQSRADESSRPGSVHVSEDRFHVRLGGRSVGEAVGDDSMGFGVDATSRVD